MCREVADNDKARRKRAEDINECEKLQIDGG